MPSRGTAFFDASGKMYRTAEEATVSDLAALLGKLGDGEGLTTGIARLLIDRRREVERIFAEHDAMIGGAELKVVPLQPGTAATPH